MVNRSTRLRVRRRMRSTGQSVRQVRRNAGEHLEKHVVRRWQKFADVKRFVAGWLVLIGLLLVGVYVQTLNLRQFYLQEVRAGGGIYTEGVVGEISNMNPIFASSAPDRSLARLVFDNLVEYDENTGIIPSLAKSWQANSERTVYTLQLREDVKWHDGEIFNAEDVLFTFSAIQQPDTGSTLQRSWRDVEVLSKGDYTVEFRLPNAFTPFMHSLTQVGMLPEHQLSAIPATELRADPFNLAPVVGTGPYRFAGLAKESTFSQVRLVRFENYYAGRPQLSEFIVQTYPDHEAMVKAFNSGDINGASGLRTQDLPQISLSQDRYDIHNPLLYNNVMLFFNTSEAPFDNRDFRRALTRATDTAGLAELLGFRYPQSDAPLLNNQLGYNRKFAQLAYSNAEAAKVLDGLGWKLAEDGTRYKDKQPLELTLISQNLDEYPAVAAEIQRQWAELGIVLKLELVEPDNFQQEYILPHAYSLLLVGIDIGVDPDVFPYWHSSEAGVGGFNLSEYKSDLVDSALEAGRTRADRQLRQAKYESFLSQWRSDAPAVALFRPTFFYAQSASVEGMESKYLADPVDRLTHVEDWSILTKLEPYQL